MDRARLLDEKKVYISLTIRRDGYGKGDEHLTCSGKKYI
jgi:hypothetical protein